MIGDARLPQRFWSKVAPNKRTGCWLWTGSNSGRDGYGTYFLGGMGSRAANKRNRTKAHRAAYAALVGPIPPGLQLDHLCRVPGCVNPAHLEPVTQAENIRRGRAPSVAGKRNAGKTRCPQGHPYSGKNLYVNPQGHRFCRTCKRASDRRRWHS